MKEIILISGVMGNLGHHLANLCVAQGYQVIGLALPLESNKHLNTAVQIVRGNVCDSSSLEVFFKSAQGQAFSVIHTAGIISIQSKAEPRLWDVNVLGTQHMVEAAKAHGVKRFIYTSSVHALPELNPGDPIFESSFNPSCPLVGYYSLSKQAATAYLLNEINVGFPGLIVYPSGIVSDVDSKEGLVAQMVKSYLKGSLRISIAGGYDFVDVRDVTQAILTILNLEKPHTSYILSNRYYSVQNLFDLLYQETHLTQVKIKIPLTVVRLSIPLLRLWSQITTKPQIFTQDSLHILNANCNFNHSLATQDFNYQPQDIQITLHDFIENYRLSISSSKIH